MADKLIYSKTKYLRGSARKARLVIDMIRGKDAVVAQNILELVNKKAAEYTLKSLNSAIANAENNFGKDKDNLYVAEARVDESFSFKRARAVSRGRNHRIIKRTHHIVIGLDVKNKTN